MPQPVNLTPRQNFQTDKKRLSSHRDLLSGEAYNVAIATALLEYQAQLAMNCKDQYSAMSMGLRLLGAQELVAKMWELGIIPELPKAIASESLDHHV